MKLLKWITAFLAGPRAKQRVILIALLLTIPSLFVPLVADEHLQATLWRTDSGRFLHDCFVFASGDRAANLQLMEHGHGAWWMPLDFKVAFWRPLAAATHAVDWSLWPGNSALMHLHTLVWFAVLLLALTVLYRRLLTPSAAILALALYAWDDARGGLLSWVANRSAIIAGLFGVCTLIAYDKWRRDAWRPGAWLAPLFLALGLLSGEMALATTAFLFGYALFLDQGTFARRMARLTPYLLIVIVWQAICVTGGYGVEASGSYVHPLYEPLAYGAKLFERAPILALGQLTPIASDFWAFYPFAAKVVMFLLAVAVLVVVARIAWPRFKANPQTGFWLTGAALALAPICAAGPGDRNLVFVGFGISAALAIVLAGEQNNPTTARWPRFVIGSLVVFNLALAPLMLPLKCLANFNMDTMRAGTDDSVPQNAAIAQKTLVVVSAPSEGGVYFSWAYRDAHQIPKPGKTRLLATSLSEVSITRVDNVTLRIRPKQGFLATESLRMLRSSSRPFRAGDIVELSNMKATVVETTTDGRPDTVDFRFAAPLEAPEWLWMSPEGFRLVNWTPPAVGETVVVPAPI